MCSNRTEKGARAMDHREPGKRQKRSRIDAPRATPIPDDTCEAETQAEAAREHAPEPEPAPEAPMGAEDWRNHLDKEVAEWEDELSFEPADRPRPKYTMGVLVHVLAPILVRFRLRIDEAWHASRPGKIENLMEPLWDGLCTQARRVTDLQGNVEHSHSAITALQTVTHDLANAVQDVSAAEFLSEQGVRCITAPLEEAVMGHLQRIAALEEGCKMLTETVAELKLEDDRKALRITGLESVLAEGADAITRLGERLQALEDAGPSDSKAGAGPTLHIHMGGS